MATQYDGYTTDYPVKSGISTTIKPSTIKIHKGGINKTVYGIEETSDGKSVFKSMPKFAYNDYVDKYGNKSMTTIQTPVKIKIDKDGFNATEYAIKTTSPDVKTQYSTVPQSIYNDEVNAIKKNLKTKLSDSGASSSKTSTTLLDDQPVTLKTTTINDPIYGKEDGIKLTYADGKSLTLDTSSQINNEIKEAKSNDYEVLPYAKDTPNPAYGTSKTYGVKLIDDKTGKNIIGPDKMIMVPETTYNNIQADIRGNTVPAAASKVTNSFEGEEAHKNTSFSEFTKAATVETNDLSLASEQKGSNAASYETKIANKIQQGLSSRNISGSDFDLSTKQIQSLDTQKDYDYKQAKDYGTLIKSTESDLKKMGDVTKGSKEYKTYSDYKTQLSNLETAKVHADQQAFHIARYVNASQYSDDITKLTKDNDKVSAINRQIDDDESKLKDDLKEKGSGSGEAEAKLKTAITEGKTERSIAYSAVTATKDQESRIHDGEKAWAFSTQSTSLDKQAEKDEAEHKTAAAKKLTSEANSYRSEAKYYTESTDRERDLSRAAAEKQNAGSASSPVERNKDLEVSARLAKKATDVTPSSKSSESEKHFLTSSTYRTPSLSSSLSHLENTAGYHETLPKKVSGDTTEHEAEDPAKKAVAKAVPKAHPTQSVGHGDGFVMH